MLTVAHVVNVDPDNPRVTVILDGWRIDGTLVSEGQREKLDLALIKIPPQALSPKRRVQTMVPICSGNPGTSQPVVVASMGVVTAATTISTPITSDGQTGTWTNLLNTGYHHGNSGGGVFSPRDGCLWGIINIELSGPSLEDGHFIDLTAFVPAAKITPFLDAYRARLAGTKGGERQTR